MTPSWAIACQEPVWKLALPRIFRRTVRPVAVGRCGIAGGNIKKTTGLTEATLTQVERRLSGKPDRLGRSRSWTRRLVGSFHNSSRWPVRMGRKPAAPGSRGARWCRPNANWIATSSRPGRAARVLAVPIGRADEVARCVRDHMARAAKASASCVHSPVRPRNLHRQRTRPPPPAGEAGDRRPSAPGGTPGKARTNWRHSRSAHDPQASV